MLYGNPNKFRILVADIPQPLREVPCQEPRVVLLCSVKIPGQCRPQITAAVVLRVAADAAQGLQAVDAGEAIKSPMPGNILQIKVSQGQHVNEGDVVIILEAMKMENEIVASKSGTVAQVLVSKGSVVETGSPLIVIA